MKENIINSFNSISTVLYDPKDLESYLDVSKLDVWLNVFDLKLVWLQNSDDSLFWQNVSVGSPGMVPLVGQRTDGPNLPTNQAKPNRSDQYP